MHQLLQVRGGNPSKRLHDFGIRLWITRDMPQYRSLLHLHSSHRGRSHPLLTNKVGTKVLRPRDPNLLKQVLYHTRTYELTDGLNLSRFSIPNNTGLLPRRNRHIKCYALQRPAQLQVLYRPVKAREVIFPTPKCQGHLARALIAMVTTVRSFRRQTRRL